MPELGHLSGEDFEGYCDGWLEQGHRPEVSDWASVRRIDIVTFAESMDSEARCFNPTFPPAALADAASREWHGAPLGLVSFGAVIGAVEHWGLGERVRALLLAANSAQQQQEARASARASAAEGEARGGDVSASTE
ncbi:hypothetical protein EMIHUDRAFT_226281 [Emiliania huxleyi CCMP1516]|uniref:Uncharacterized protein n=2 Tax=Emiliania huxleyi TaxID=2903 RepID=A0A0D3KL83_EMIH1|nr:hypothetical protein EMIHUDRAFT_226281 [Emiliania huxleyi CCMP1516]EOD36518.1 hypothetical protein EMIHUDRAFT_226281 [Emiliania huxleyi CCMP1516]|eukprot:XP_005788947.1 hypothetical protein EMIHUDRAFT_226281 [Emiliania huxleyi CCMP1516]